MANTFTNQMETILRYGQLALRENAVFPRLVATDFTNEDAKKGNTVDFPVPRAGAAEAVTAGSAPTYKNIVQDNQPIVMDQWRQSAFQLSDKEMKEVDANGIFPSEASEALKVLVNELDNYVITKMYTKCPYHYGTAGTTATSTSDIVGVRKKLQINNAPASPRAMVIDSTVEANFLNLAAFASVDQSGRLDGLEAGNMGRKYGFDMAANQNLESTSITAGTHDGSEVVNNASHAIGDTSTAIDGGTGTAVVGETFTVAGDTQTYVVTSAVADTSSGTLNYWPPAKVAWADNAAITFTYAASTAVAIDGVGFHRDFFGLVNRRLPDPPAGTGIVSSSVVDPVTGLNLRLQVTHSNHMTNWAWDILYGGAVIRPELGAILIG